MFEHEDFEGLHAELRDDNVGLITFNRPEKLNPLTAQGLRDLGRVLRRLGDAAECGAVVITGEGRAFNSGMDLTVPLEAGPDGDPMRAVYEAMRLAVGSVIAMREIRQPVIAAIPGPAIGGGFAIAAAADIRICSPGAAFLAPFLKLGVSVGDMGLSWMLPRLIGAGAAAEVLYSGTPLGAEDAYRLRLVQHVVDDPLEAAITMAAQIAARPRLGVQMSKELLNASIGAGGMREHLEMEMRSQVIGLMTADHQAAKQAFLNRLRG